MPALEQRYEPAFPIAELEEHPDNPRHGDEAAINESIEVHGFYGAVVVQSSTRRIIAGNHRTRVARARGELTIPALFIDVDDDRARRILLVDNRTNDRASYGQAELVALLAELAASDSSLAGTGWTEGDLAELLAELEQAEPSPAPGRLTDRFLAPPFSVLDGRAGYWRERKARWLRWGVRRGRDDGRPIGSSAAKALRLDSLKNSAGLLIDSSGQQVLRSGEGRPANLLNFSDTVRMGAYSGGDAWGWSGTSIFDPVLCEVLYRWFCPPGGRVADPFCGGSVRGAVASALGLRYAGYDLRPEQLAANEAQADELGLEPRPDWRLGDAREASWDGPFDMLLTCPPYWHLERYSDDERDLSNAETADDFGAALAGCLRPALEALAPDSFAVLVLGAMRHGHQLVDLPGLGLELLAREGLTPYNDLAFLTPLASAALRAAKNFALRKPTPVHQRVLVAVKGDPERAVERCGPVEVLADEAMLAGWLEAEPTP